MLLGYLIFLIISVAVLLIVVALYTIGKEHIGKDILFGYLIYTICNILYYLLNAIK